MARASAIYEELLLVEQEIRGLVLQNDDILEMKPGELKVVHVLQKNLEALVRLKKRRRELSMKLHSLPLVASRKEPR